MSEDWENLTAGMPESNGSRYYRRFPVRIGIVCDRFFLDSVRDAAEFAYIRPESWREDVRGIDCLLVVSAWDGLHGDWVGLVAPGHPRRQLLLEIMDACRGAGIPVVFHSKEDPPSYAQFLPFAQRADHVFTSCVEKVDDYRRACSHDRVAPLMFCINPRFHNPVGSRVRPKFRDVVFAGAWYGKFPERCRAQEMLLDGVLTSGRGLRIIDRFQGRAADDRYRFPARFAPFTRPPVDHALLQKVHRLFDWAVNINTITDSATMFANRAVELQALGSLLVSNRSLGMCSHYPGVFAVGSSAEVAEVLTSFSEEEERAMQISGIRRVMTGETCFDRVAEILAACGIHASQPRRSVLVVAERLTERVRAAFDRQSYPDRTLCAVSEVTEEIYAAADMVAFLDEEASYSRCYLQDMVDAFKYVDCDYVTQDAHYDGGVLVPGVEHGYVDRVVSRGRTVFWREAFGWNELRAASCPWSRRGGYAAAATCYDARPRRRDADARPDLSVVIPFRNVQRELGPCLDSVLKQTACGGLELVCVDDGSTDHSSAMLDVRARRDPRIVSVWQENAGPGAARNAGLSAARGEYVAFLDADDTLVSGENLQAALARAQEDGLDVLLAEGREARRDGTFGQETYLRPELVPAARVFDPAAVGEGLFILASMAPWAKLFRRVFLRDCGLSFPPLRRSEDFAFVQMALIRARRLGVLRHPLVNHVVDRPASLESTRDADPLAFMEGERIFREELGRCGLLSTGLRPAGVASVFRAAYHLKGMRRKDGFLRVAAAVAAAFPEFDPGEDVGLGQSYGDARRYVMDVAAAGASPAQLERIFAARPGMAKTLRGVLKQFFPYAIQARYMRRRYGMYEWYGEIAGSGMGGRVLWAVLQLLPYGFVRMLLERWIRAPRKPDGRSDAEVDFQHLQAFVKTLNPRLERPCAATSSGLFSVVMPTYNRARCIRRAVDSLLAQTYAEFELVIVDDGSTDGTGDLLRDHYGEHFKTGRIRYVRVENGGVCKARNAGLRLCRGEWIAYLDSDNVLCPDFLETFVAAQRAHPSARAFYARLLHAGTHRVVGRPFDAEALLRGNFIDLGVYVHHRSLYGELGGFDERMTRLVDWELVTRYSKRETPVYLNRIVLLYDDTCRGDRITDVADFFGNYNYFKAKHCSYPTVTTLLFCRNHAGSVGAALDCAVSQRGEFVHEILVSDEGSTDGTRELVAGYARRYPGLVRDISDGSGAGILPNLRGCLAAAAGKYIAVLEGDAIWNRDDKLALQIDFLERNGDCSMVFARTRVLKDGKPSLSTWHDGLPEKLTGEDLRSVEAAGQLMNSSCCMFRAEVLKELPESIAEGVPSEAALAFHLKARGCIGYIRTPLVVCRAPGTGTGTGDGGAAETSKARSSGLSDVAGSR